MKKYGDTKLIKNFKTFLVTMSSGEPQIRLSNNPKMRKDFVRTYYAVPAVRLR